MNHGRYQRGAHLVHLFNQTQETALDIFKVVSQKLVYIFVELHLDSNNEPLRVHFEQEQEGEQTLAP